MTNSPIPKRKRVLVFKLKAAPGFPIHFVSPNAADLLGYTLEETIGSPLRDLVDPDFTSEVDHQESVPVPFDGIDLPLVTREDQRVWLEFDASLASSMSEIQSDNGLLVRHAIDQTELRQAAEELRATRDVLEQSSRAIAVHDPKGIVEWVNDRYLADTGFRREDLIGRSVPIISDDRRDLSRRKEAIEAIHQGHAWRGELKFMHQRGDVRWGLVSFDPILDKSGKVVRYVSMIEDITELKEAQEKLEKMAFNDPLTELPNRRQFLERLQLAVEASRRGQSLGALLYLDLDQFKQINDTLGHSAGDTVLETVAQRLKKRLRKTDIVSRIGGDEFTILLMDVKNRGTCAQIAEDILATIARPITIDRGTRDVTASIGITIIPEDSLEADRLLDNADRALYEAKGAGKNRYHFFSRDQEPATEPE